MEVDLFFFTSYKNYNFAIIPDAIVTLKKWPILGGLWQFTTSQAFHTARPIGAKLIGPHGDIQVDNWAVPVDQMPGSLEKAWNFSHYDSGPVKNMGIENL